MKNVIPAVLVMAFVFAACNSNTDKSTETKTNETTTMDTITKPEVIKPAAEQLYTCSMHPEVIGKKDEKCSKCGMNLTEPVKKSETP